MASTKAFYLVEAAHVEYDEYDSMLVVARSETQAIKLCTEDTGEHTILRHAVFESRQGPFTAKRISQFMYKIGDKPIASFNAG
jgi:hypothetical protein